MLGGDGSWDYVVPDPPHHRLFIARQNPVMAVDEDSGKLLGEVTGIQAAHGTAGDEASGHGFGTSGNDQSVVMFGAGVDGAGFDAASGNAFASNADGTLTVIHQDSPDRYRVAETVPTPQGSRNMGLDPTNRRVYLVAAKFGDAPAGGRGRRPLVSGTFSLLVIERAPASH